MNDTVLLVAVGGALIVGGYFVYKSTSLPTDIVSDSCAGDWTDYLNPACWWGKVGAEASNAGNQISNELNTVLIVLAVVVILVIALLAFGPGTEHLARGAALFA